MAKILYYSATMGLRGYVFVNPDSTGGSTPLEKHAEFHLAADYAETEQFNRYHVIWPVEGWLNKGYVKNIQAVYSDEPDEPEENERPNKVVLDPALLTLSIAGGTGAAYVIEYRDRDVDKLSYSAWKALETVSPVGNAVIKVTIATGKARQYRVKTTGGGKTDSVWVLCQSELISVESVKNPKKSGSILLHVFDSGLNYKGRVESWTSLMWNEDYQDKGGFQLDVNDTDKNAALLQRGDFICRNDRTSVMVAVMVERDSETGGITVGGYTATHLLSYRVALGKTVVGNVELGIYDIVRANQRGLPFGLAAPIGFGASLNNEEFENTELLDAVLTMAREGNLGVRTVFDHASHTIEFQVYKGIDRTYGTPDGHVFSTEFGNMSRVIVTEDDDQLKNVAVVVCGTGNETRTFVYEAAEGLEGVARRELLVTGDSIAEGQTVEEWEKAMLDFGKQELTKYNLALNFQVTPKADQYGIYYHLGDVVTCKGRRYGLLFDACITQVREVHDSNGSRLSMVMGEPMIKYYRR